MTIRNSFPDVRPALNLDFANTKRLDPRITFTRASTGTYVDELGVIKTAASNEARFDHDTSGNSLGLLIEESRVNYFKNSVDLGSSLTGGPCVLTANSATAPDNTFTATKVAETLTNVTQSKSLAFNEWATPNGSAGTSNIPLVLTGFVKAGTLNNCIVMMGNGGAIILANIDLTDGTFTQYKWSGVTEDKITVVPFPNGWYKFTIQAKINYPYNLIHVFPCIDGLPSAGPRQGNGDYFYAWGFQWEVGSFPTSYIPTSGSTATRSADVASMTGTNFSSWYNQSEGTVVGNGYSVPSGGFWNFKSASLIRWFSLLHGYTEAFDGIAGGSLINLGYDGLTYYQTAFAIDNINLKHSGTKNGATATTINGDNTTGVNALELGYINSLNLYLNGHIARLTYYDRRLTDAQLQALTL